MNDTMQHQVSPAKEQAAAVEAIRDVCNQTEPEVLWEALEAKGIETTPGMIYQLFNKTPDPEQAHKPEGNGTGLSAEDMATLSALAGKAGGVDQLIRMLQVWQEHAK